MSIPFSESEMIPVFEQAGFPGAPARTLWNSPISLRENLLKALTDKDCEFLPNTLDMQPINPRFLPDNRARGVVTDGGVPFTPNPEGETDAFGVTWIYDPVINGSMVKPGSPLLEDIEDWEQTVVFPEPEAWPWKELGDQIDDLFPNPEGIQFARKSTIFTGFFERLISWLDFENAAIALVVEDQQECVHAIFNRLTDLYCSYIDHFKDYFDIDVIELHDDWGSQMGPMISEATIREMILPYLQRVVQHAHEKGVLFEFHSCGKIESLVPIMIDAGVDMWMGQTINDKKSVIERYGDKLVVEVEAPAVGEDASDEEVWAEAEKFATEYLIPGKPCALSVYSADQPNRPLLTEALYVLSRKIYGSKND